MKKLHFITGSVLISVFFSIQTIFACSTSDNCNSNPFPAAEGIGFAKTRSASVVPQNEGDLVNIQDINSSILVDIRYATEDNFAKKKLYDSNTCFLRKSSASKLESVQKELNKMHLGLKVWDCYRPLSVQKALWDIMPDDRYVANPYKGGSRHNRGSAVDLTIIDEHGKELPMPTAFDDFTPKAHQEYPDLPAEVIKNRTLLRNAMKKAGFLPLADEWWHYDDENWKEFDLLDVPLSRLN